MGGSRRSLSLAPSSESLSFRIVPQAAGARCLMSPVGRWAKSRSEWSRFHLPLHRLCG